MLRPIAFLLIFAGSAPGQEDRSPRTPVSSDELRSTVQVSPAGDLIGPWQGFAVELESRTKRDLDLTIRIEDDSFLGVATRRERLSPGGRKRVFLYSPGGIYSRSVAPRYRITDSSGRELAAGIVPINARGYMTNIYQVALFSRTASSEQDFGFPTGMNGQEVRFARLSPETFPDRWAGLSALDLIAIHDAPLDELTTDQSRALADYVRQGGTVVLSPGPAKGWLTHPVLAAFAPVRAGEPQLVSSLPGLTTVFGPFRRADPFLVHPLAGGIPFNEAIGSEIVRIPWGFGRTYVLSFDVQRAPFDTWKGRNRLWTTLLGAAPRWFQEDRSSFPSAATARQRLDLFHQMARLINPYPSFGLILGLAAIFLLAVGPLNYLFLWKLRRSLLLVVTVPGISIAFLALILTLGYVLKGTSTVVHSARLLSTRSGLDCARELHLYSLFSPSTRTYDVAAEPGTFGLPSSRWGNADDRRYSRGEAMMTLTCETGAGITMRGLGTGQWQSWNLEARALRDLGKGVRFEQSGASVRIENASPRHIERGVFVQTGGPDILVIPFGELPPGKTEEPAGDGRRVDPLAALGAAPDSLEDRLLRPWLESITKRPRSEASIGQKPQRFLICVLRNEGEPVRIDARASDRSRSVTLLHVAEAP